MYLLYLYIYGIFWIFVNVNILVKFLIINNYVFFLQKDCDLERGFDEKLDENQYFDLKSGFQSFLWIRKIYEFYSVLIVKFWFYTVGFIVIIIYIIYDD